MKEGLDQHQYDNRLSEGKREVETDEREAQRKLELENFNTQGY